MKVRPAPGLDKVAVTGDLADCYHNDRWAPKEFLTVVEDLAAAWVKIPGYDPAKHKIEIGDLNLWKSGKNRHAGHQDGFSIDIRTLSAGKYDLAGRQNDLEMGVKFVQLAKKNGFGRVITQCPHITRECNGSSESEYYVTQDSNHQHHFHMDYSSRGTVKEHLKKSWCKECDFKAECNSKHKRETEEDSDE